MYYAVQGLAFLFVLVLYLVLRKSKSNESQSGYFKDKIGDPIPSLPGDTRFRRFTNGLVPVGSLTMRSYLDYFGDYSDANELFFGTERRYQTKGLKNSEIDHFL
jgi:hypothetical protein